MKKNIFYKVKTLAMITAVSALAGGSLTSCSDFLDIPPQNEITEEQFWNEQKDVENIITGCYSEMQSYAMLSRMMIWGEFRSDNIINNGTIKDDVQLERVLKEDINASNPYTTWADFYRVINRCNNVIKNAPKVAEMDPSYTKSQVNAHIAEVTALRALCYFYLIRTYKDVPYSEEVFLDDSQQLTLPQTPFNDVLSKLIASLEAVKDYALNKYPESNTQTYWDYNYNRVTKNLIYSMLCEMYLWQKDYDKCIEYADLIIEAKKKDAKEKKYTETDFQYVNGYPLITSHYPGQNYYGRAFSSIFATGNSMESIFELNFRKDDTNGRHAGNGPVANFYGHEDLTPYVIATTYVAQDQSDKLYKIYAKENDGRDGRAYENVRFSSGKPVYINKFSTQGSVLIQTTTPIYEHVSYSAQYSCGEKHAVRNKSNWIIYRLTDIMLLKAEALAQKITEEGSIQTGTTDYELLEQAFDLVDAVNKRSLVEATPYTHVLDIANYATKNSIVELVMQERQRELMFEGKRYFDLVRRSMRDGNTNYLANNVSNKNPSTASFVRAKMQNFDAIFWPINLEELKVNKNLHQNPAFGSGENSSYE